MKKLILISVLTLLCLAVLCACNDSDKADTTAATTSPDSENTTASTTTSDTTLAESQTEAEDTTEGESVSDTESDSETTAEADKEVVIEAEKATEYKDFTIGMPSPEVLNALNAYDIRHIVGNSWAFVKDNGTVVGLHLVWDEGAQIRSIQEIYVFTKDFSGVTEADLQKITVGMPILEVVNTIGVSEGTFVSAVGYYYSINGKMYVIGVNTSDGSVAALPRVDE